MTSLSPTHLPALFDLDVEDDLVDVTPPAGPPAPPAPAYLTLPQRLARGHAAAPIAFTLALTLHAAAIAAGLCYLHTRTAPPDRIEQVRIVLPYGGPADHPGHDGAALASADDARPPILLPPIADASADSSTDPTPLAAPPSDFQSPPPAPPVDSALDATQGTLATGPLPALDSTPPAPPIFSHTLPIAADPGPAANSSAADAPHATDNAAVASASAAPANTANNVTPGNTSTASAAQPTDAPSGGPRGSATGAIDPQSIPVYYPARALANRWGGTTLARFNVDDRGRVRKIRILLSSDHDLLDEEVRDGLNRWRPPRVLWGTVDNTVPFNFNPPPEAAPR